MGFLDFSVVKDRLKSFDITASKETAVAVTSDYGAKGDGATDDTKAIQAALDSGAGVIYFPAGTFMVNTNDGPHTVENVTAMTNTNVGLKVRSNTTLFFESGGTLKAIPNDKFSYTMLNLNGVSNVNVLGGELVGDRDTHQITYTTSRGGSNKYAGETGWGIMMAGASNILIHGTKISKMWGDAIDLFASNDIGAKTNTNITIKNVVIDANRRQGISIESADGVVIDNAVIKNTQGTAPAAGIDIEPANFTDPSLRAARNITIKHTLTRNNDNAGILLYGMSKTADGWNSGGAIIDSVTIEHCTFDGNNTNNFNINDKGGWEMAFNGNVAVVGASNVVIKQAKLVNPNPAGHLVDDNPNRIYPANSQPNAGIYVGYSQNVTVTDSHLFNMDVTIAGPRSTLFAYTNTSANVTGCYMRQLNLDPATPSATVTKSNNRYYDAATDVPRYGRQIGLWRASSMYTAKGKPVSIAYDKRGNVVWRKRPVPSFQVVYSGQSHPLSLVQSTPATATSIVDLTADVTGKTLLFDLVPMSNRPLVQTDGKNLLAGWNAAYWPKLIGLDLQLSIAQDKSTTDPLSTILHGLGWNTYGGSYQFNDSVVSRLDMKSFITVTRMPGQKLEITVPVLDVKPANERGLVWLSVSKISIL